MRRMKRRGEDGEDDEAPSSLPDDSLVCGWVWI